MARMNNLGDWEDSLFIEIAVSLAYIPSVKGEEQQMDKRGSVVVGKGIFQTDYLD